MKKDWLKLVLNPSANFIIEKTNANAARMLWLQENFPESYFIHIIRNGYAAALGIEKKIKLKVVDDGHLLQRSANQWARSTEIVLEDSKMIDIFFETSYEDLTNFPNKTLNKIYYFLHIEPFHKSILNKTFKIHEINDKIENKNPPRLMQMTTEQKKIIESKADKMLTHYRYEID